MIMVDELVAYPRAQHRIFRAGACHLTTDGSLDELHAFAATLGMRRSWFQEHALAPHYDLTAPRRAKALKLGAVFVPAKEQARQRIEARSR
jgi:hypothetical protein